jgi:hypothetical protein
MWYQIAKGDPDQWAFKGDTRQSAPLWDDCVDVTAAWQENKPDRFLNAMQKVVTSMNTGLSVPGETDTAQHATVLYCTLKSTIQYSTDGDTSLEPQVLLVDQRGGLVSSVMAVAVLMAVTRKRVWDCKHYMQRLRLITGLHPEAYMRLEAWTPEILSRGEGFRAGRLQDRCVLSCEQIHYSTVQSRCRVASDTDRPRVQY